jgi:hypothetical protein
MDNNQKKEPRPNQCKRCRYWDAQSNRWGYCNQSDQVAPGLRFSYTGIEDEGVRIMTPRYAVCEHFKPLPSLPRRQRPQQNAEIVKEPSE